MTEAYKYYERYYIDFTSAPNGDGEVFTYHVSLQQRLVIPSFGSEPMPVELDGGRSPFVVSLQNEANPLMPMRSASARISFVDDIDLGELLPADAFEWRVELTRTTDGAKIFVGYLTAEVYTQPASGGVNVVTVNAASPMVPIAATAMPIEDKGALTIGELIRMAIETSDDIQTVYIPAIYSLKNNASAADYADLLRWRFSTGNFLRFTDEAVSGKNVECDTYQVALEAVCKLFGWSMVDCGDGSLYFISPAYQGPYMRVARTQLDSGRFTPELVTPSAFDSLAIIPIDKADTVDYQQGAGSASVTPSVKNATLEMQSFLSKASGWVYSLNPSTVVNRYDGKVYTVEVGKVVAKNAPKAVFPRYRATVTESDGKPSASWQEVVDGSENPFYDVQAELRRIDTCAEADLEGGAEAKKTWSFDETILLNDFIAYGVRPNNMGPYILFHNSPVVKIIGRLGFVTSGAINIDFSLRAVPQDGYYIGDNFTDFNSKGLPAPIPVNPRYKYNLEGGQSVFGHQFHIWGQDLEVTDNRKKITASLRLGSAYWNGYAWDNAFTTFEIPLMAEGGEWHPVESNKIITMPYDGDSGIFAEIYSTRSGEVEFCIYRASRYTEDVEYDSDGLTTYDSYPIKFEMKGLSISYVPTLDYVDVDDADSIYQREFRTSFTEKVGESLILHSRVNNSEQMSLIYDSQEDVIDTLHRTTSTTAEKPERFLLDEYERIFGRTQRRWRRGLWLRELRPLDIFTLPAVTDSALMLTGYTMDFEENTAEAYLLDVKTINLVKYVE